MLKIIIGLCCLLGYQIALASNVALAVDNDLLLGKDSRYTSGLRASWLSTPKAIDNQQCGHRLGICMLPAMTPKDGKQAWGIALQQIMLTPSHIDRKTPDYNDIPYLGISQLDVSIYRWNDQRLTGYGVRAGVIGQDSLAEPSQKFIHRVTGSKQPTGWDRQLGNQAVGGAYFIQSQRLVDESLNNGYSWMSHLTYGADANNFVGSAKMMLTLSYGRDMNKRFVPDSSWLGTNAPLVNKNERTAPSGWNIFAGLSAERQFYDYMEHNAPDVYRLHARDWIGGALLGYSYHWSTFEIRASIVATQNRYGREHGPQAFGNITALWRL